MKVNGHDDIPYMKWKIKFMFETTNQTHKLWPFIGLTKNLVRYLQFNNLGSWNSHWACSNPPLGIDGRGVNASIWGLPATFETEPTASSPPQKKNVKNHVPRWSKAIRFRAVPQDLRTASRKSRGNPKRVMAMSSPPLDDGNVDLIHGHLNLICFA